MFFLFPDECNLYVDVDVQTESLIQTPLSQDVISVEFSVNFSIESEPYFLELIDVD